MILTETEKRDALNSILWDVLADKRFELLHVDMTAPAREVPSDRVGE